MLLSVAYFACFALAQMDLEMYHESNCNQQVGVAIAAPFGDCQGICVDRKDSNPPHAASQFCGQTTADALVIAQSAFKSVPHVLIQLYPNWGCCTSSWLCHSQNGDNGFGMIRSDSVCSPAGGSGGYYIATVQSNGSVTFAVYYSNAPDCTGPTNVGPTTIQASQLGKCIPDNYGNYQKVSLFNQPLISNLLIQPF